MGILGILAGPIGWLMQKIFNLVNDYFVTILLITLLVRIVTFPLNLKSQKSMADRARLAPRLERIQKKYGQDKQKMAAKQQELYQKEGVSMTGGCLPILVNMLVLFSVLAVIYSPLQYLTTVPDDAIAYTVEVVKEDNYKDGGLFAGQTPEGDVVAGNQLSGYYKEMNMLRVMESNRQNILAYLQKEAEGKTAYTAEQAQDYYDQMMTISENFSIGKYTLLDTPWRNGFADISLLWLIPLLSGLSAFAMSFLSQRYSKASMGDQPGAGCSNGALMYGMPLFSLFMTFIVPGGVGMYWIFSNIIGIGQTYLLNKIYNPAKIRAQAEKEYEERRRQKAEDKKRLAAEHAREQAEEDRRRQEEKKQGKKAPHKAKAPVPAEQPEPTEEPEQEPEPTGEPETEEPSTEQDP